jgi:hypothetical protein
MWLRPEICLRDEAFFFRETSSFFHVGRKMYSVVSRILFCCILSVIPPDFTFFTQVGFVPIQHVTHTLGIMQCFSNQPIDTYSHFEIIESEISST